MRKKLIMLGLIFITSGIINLLLAEVRITERWGKNSNCHYKEGHMDTYLFKQSPNANYGSSNKLIIHGVKDSEKYVVFRFDLAALANRKDVIIHQARLWLYMKGDNNYFYGTGRYSCGGTARVFAISDPEKKGLWNESEVTYNNRKTGVPWCSAGNVFNCIDQGKVNGESWLWAHTPGGEAYEYPYWTWWDISLLTQAWISGAKENQGLLIDFDPVVNFTLYSSVAMSSKNTAADKRPYLEITYSYPGLVTNSYKPVQASNIKTFHRIGQTFITWEEAKSGKEEEYSIYKSKELITSVNLDKVKLLAIIPKGSSYYKLYGDLGNGEKKYKDVIQKNFIIEELGKELSDTTGLFVYTMQANEAAGDYYYAVTSKVEGNENREDFSEANVIKVSNEKYSEIIKPVLIKKNGGGRLYTQWMDYTKWPEQLEGYAHNTWIEVPKNYNPEKSYLVRINLHAYVNAINSHVSWEEGVIISSYYGNGNFVVIPLDVTLSWWYGFFDNYNTNKPPKYVVNYTEAHVYHIIKWLTSGIDWKVDPDRVSVVGGSMGGTGAWTVSLHHPELFASVYASKGINNWSTEAKRQGGWSIGSHVGTLQQKFPAYDIISGKECASNVYDWLNLRDYVLAKMTPSDYLPFYGYDHGTYDGTIHWTGQGYPMYKDEGPFAKIRQSFVAMWEPQDHNPWFTAESSNLNVSRKESVLAFTNATCNDKDPVPTLLVGGKPDPPGNKGGTLNLRLEWSSSVNNFAGLIVDKEDRYEVVIKLNMGKYGDLGNLPNASYQGPNPCTADITPRRLQKFKIKREEGGYRYTYHWKNINMVSKKEIQQGTVYADVWNLITIPQFSISDKGNKLVIEIEKVGVEEGKVEAKNLLCQSYPNPFNPECFIPYEVGNNCKLQIVKCKIKIYNILGQVVKELDLGEKQAGSYVTKDKAAYWDGRDNKGKEVVSGVYYYELVVNGKVVGVKKSLVVK